MTNVIFVPKKLREHVMHWFHASLEGGHQGINKTNKRMRKFVGWPGMLRDLRKYVECCPCRRVLKMSNQLFRGVRGVLECPRPLELVSIDFVGPKSWNGKEWYVACMVDHATRYMFNVVSHTNKSKDAKRALIEWCGIFGAPQAILHDNGTEFTAEEFRNYVMCRLRVRFIRTSPYYPQANAINESSHQSLNNMMSSQAICARSEPFEEIVRVATTCYNATPHPSLGASPYYAMFGSEMMFPGWQKLSTHAAQIDKFRNLLGVRLQAVMRARVRELEKTQVPEEDNSGALKVGDWVWYKLGEYEKNSHFGSANITNTTKLQPRWSWPCKVLEIRNGKQLLVQSLGSPQDAPRLVPLTQARLIPTDIPKSLAALQLKNIQIEAPRIPPSHRKLDARGDVSMNDLMDVARKHRDKTKASEIMSLMFVKAEKVDNRHEQEVIQID